MISTSKVWKVWNFKFALKSFSRCIMQIRSRQISPVYSSFSNSWFGIECCHFRKKVNPDGGMIRWEVERVARNKALYKIESMDNSEPGEGGALVSSRDVERRIMVTRHEPVQKPSRVMEARINLMQNIGKSRPSLPLFFSLSLSFIFRFRLSGQRGLLNFNRPNTFYPLIR